MTPKSMYTEPQLQMLAKAGSDLKYYGNLNSGVGIIKIQKQQEGKIRNGKKVRGVKSSRLRLEKQMRKQAKKLGAYKGEKIRYNTKKVRIEKYVGRKNNFRIWKELTDKEAQIYDD